MASREDSDSLWVPMSAVQMVCEALTKESYELVGAIDFIQNK
jgi:hypothetical protein